MGFFDFLKPITQIAGAVAPFLGPVGLAAEPFIGGAGVLENVLGGGGGGQQQQNPAGGLLSAAVPYALTNAQSRNNWGVAEQIMNSNAKRVDASTDQRAQQYLDFLKGLQNPALQQGISPTTVSAPTGGGVNPMMTSSPMDAMFAPYQYASNPSGGGGVGTQAPGATPNLNLFTPNTPSLGPLSTATNGLVMPPGAPAGAKQIASPNPNGAVFTNPNDPGINGSFQQANGEFFYDPNSGSGDQQGRGKTWADAVADARTKDGPANWKTA